MEFTLKEVKNALKKEDIGASNSKYVIQSLVSAKLASKLQGFLSDTKTDCFEVAKSFLYGYLDTESVVRLAHGENMNKVYNIISDFKLELEQETKK